MTEQPTLFETPQERTSREYNEQLAAYMAERATPDGWQCQECGGIERSQTLFWNNHGIMGTRCMAERLSRNHILFYLQHMGPDMWDREHYIRSTGRLRAIAAWKASQR